jgi:hypothetical protein
MPRKSSKVEVYTWHSGTRQAGGRRERRTGKTGNRRTAGVPGPQSYRGHGADSDRPYASHELRGRMNAELAQYVYPRRKAVEVATDQDALPPCMGLRL